MPPIQPLTLCIVVAACLLATDAAAADVPHGERFQNDIVPLLASRCLSCHNDRDRKGDFSLATKRDAFESGHVVAGKPDDSALLLAIKSTDGERASMPKNGEPLTAEQIETVRQWIADGAPWPEDVKITDPVVSDFNWWSLKPLVAPEIPRFEAGSPEADWIRTPIDAFILHEQKRRGLESTPEADRRVLIRRLSFDLSGLPPTPEEIDEFLSDDDPLAYERLVDRLLESPGYGERWARHWLDVVKYADTCGYDKDKLRPNAWPYRDYVIRAFNEDKPYARFIEEQLAGDVLYPGTADGILGLGFIAAGPWDFIGHVEVPESKIDGQIARHTDRDEMASNALNTFCSATVQCAQCHNHKFDPFTQQHYYNLQSVFAAVDRAERPYDTDPSIETERAQIKTRLADAEGKLRNWNQVLSQEGGDELAAIDAKIAEVKSGIKVEDLRPEYGYHSAVEADETAEKWVEVDLGREVEISRIVLHPCYDDFAAIGPGFGFPRDFQVSLKTQDEGPAVTIYTGRDVDSVGSLAPTDIPAAGTKTRIVRVSAQRLAVRQNDFHFALAELEVFDREGRNVSRDAKVSALDSIEAPVRWRQSNLTDGIWPRPSDEVAAKTLAGLQKQRKVISDRINTPERMAKRERLEKAVSAAKEALSRLPAGRMVYAAATHFEPEGSFRPTNGQPRDVKLLHRGNVQQPIGPTQPGIIPVIQGEPTEFDLPEDHSEGDRRAALAQWITRHDNPLTWRSIVNRVWQWHFGQGLVDSPNDFGRMGKQPSHPELLDWLAADFRDHGMSFKRLHRMIVTSAVYRQASVHSETNSLIDADNRYLWRMNRRRLEAEELRDAMLACSGRLNREMGGPGYYLFVLERPEHSPHYEYSKFDADDPASHRRSAYRFVVRSQPDPYMTTLDCADSSQSTPQRNETLTALQALSLLNNDFSLTMARHFADQVASRPGERADQITWAFRAAVGRSPTADELEMLEEFTAQNGLPNLCRALMNLSEFVFVD